MSLLKLSIILCSLLCSCSTFKTGYYTVVAVRGNTVEFKEVKGDYHVPNSDTLKVGSKIYIQRTNKSNLANVW